MRRLVLTLACALCAGLCGVAQVVQVSHIERMAVPEDAAQVAGVSPAGNYVLLTSECHGGLTLLDLATGERRVISAAAGAGYNVGVSQDGNHIVYRQVGIDNKKLRQVGLQHYNVTTGVTQPLAAPSRGLQAVQVTGNIVMTVDKGQASVKRLDGSQAAKAVMAYATQNYELMVAVNGKTRHLTPLGADKRYIWVSLSPGGEKVLFYVSGDAAYVCNIDGTGLQKLGTLRAARWLDDNIVVGMNDKDNGETYVSSEIVAVDLQGHRQVLTGKEVIAMYPQCGGGKIAFSTPTGEVYLIHLTK